MPAEAALPSTYRSLIRVPGLLRLLVAALLGRTAIQMLSVAMVLFVLERFHSPTLAGLTVFAYAFPGVMVSPLAGALLDRSGRTALIRLDYSIAAAAIGLILILNVTGTLDPGLLVGVAVLGSVTSPLSSAGARSLFPILVPRHLWDRANAIDSGGYVVAAVAGAPLAAVIAGLAGRPAALLATAAMFLAAALSLIGAGRLTEARPAGPLRDVPRQAWAGLAYVARNPTLRGLAIGLSVMNLASGLLIVALPLLVLDRLHAGVAVVGALWALSAATGGVCALVAGHRGSQGRELRMMAAGGLAGTIALAALAVAPDLPVVVLAVLLWGGGGGWMDIGMFSIRQRRTDPEWFGRAFAVSMSMNYAGSPLGSALAGPVLAPGLGIGIGAGALATLAGIAILLLMVPARAGKVRPVTASPFPGG